MRGFRPRRLEGYSKGKGKKSLLEGDQFFSDEDEFDDVFYSEREKDYVKKSNKTWKSSTKTTIPPKKLPIPRPHPPCRQESVELTQSEAARNPKEEFAPSLSSELIEKVKSQCGENYMCCENNDCRSLTCLLLLFMYC